MYAAFNFELNDLTEFIQLQTLSVKLRSRVHTDTAMIFHAITS